MSGDKGAAFLAEGEKALNKKSVFGFLGLGGNNFEEAAESFVKAGNAFKLSNQWQSAGDAFLKAASAQQKVADNTDAVNSYVEAANCYKRINPVDAVGAYNQAIELYNNNGRFGMSARYTKELAELFEQDNNKDSALVTYKEAARLYSMDNKESNANQMLIKVATFSSEMNQFQEAANIYEDVGKKSMESRLGSYSAKGYFFQCLLCHMAAGDVVAVHDKLDHCKGIDFSFSSSRECDLIEKLIKAAEDINEEDFSQACADFDRISPLDPWKTSMLLKAKKHITDAAGEDGIDLS